MPTFDANKPNLSGDVEDIVTDTKDNLNALKTDLDAHKAETADPHGIGALITSKTDYEAHKTSPTAHGLDVDRGNITALTTEIIAGRGSMATLAARLAVALQANGAIKLSTLATKWGDNGDVPTYVSTTQFTVPGDRTKVYQAGVQLRATIATGYVYGDVLSSSFGGGVTTVTLSAGYPVLAASLSKVEFGFFAFDAAVQAAIAALSAADTSFASQLAALAIPLKRNFVINGDMRIAQRAAPNLSNAFQYGRVDRWAAKGAGTAVSAGTIDQITNATLSRSGYALRLAGVTITGAGEVYVRTRVESRDAVGLKNATATVGLRVRHDAGAAIDYVITVRRATAQDDFTGVTDILASGNLSVGSGADATISLANISMADCTNGIEVEVKAACGAVTTKNFDFGEVRLHEGGVLTGFEGRPLEQEQLLCKRYYQQYGGGHASEAFAAGQAYGAGAAVFAFLLEMPMRVAPAVTVSAVSDFALYNSAAGTAVPTGFSWDYPTNRGFRLNATGAAGLTAGDATLLAAANTNARLKFDAEL